MATISYGLLAAGGVGGGGLAVWQTVALFGLIPLTLFATITGLVWVSSRRAAAASTWHRTPVWINAPAENPQALLIRAYPADEEGGASGRW